MFLIQAHSTVNYLILIFRESTEVLEGGREYNQIETKEAGPGSVWSVAFLGTSVPEGRLIWRQLLVSGTSNG